MGPIPPAWFLQPEWGRLFPLPLPLPSPERGGSRLAQRKRWWGNQKISQTTVRTVPSRHGTRGRRGAEHPSAGTPKPPFPWRPLGDQHSLHLPPTPATGSPQHRPMPPATLRARSTKLWPFPAVVTKPRNWESLSRGWESLSRPRQSGWRRRGAAKEERAESLGKRERSYL